MFKMDLFVYLCRKNTWYMKNVVLIGLFCLVVILLLLCLYYYNRWKVLWNLEEPRPIYAVHHHNDDTLRVVMIGDSWIEMHTEQHLDSILQNQISEQTSRPVLLKAKGKGGMRSRGVYDLMFKNEGYGTKPLIVSGADYCVISAGINDASANLGTRQYCHYMKLIIKHLLANEIRPVIIEAPDVNIWKLFGQRPFKNIAIDSIRSIMTGCGMYHYAEYREALRKSLNDDLLKDSVVYVRMYDWNGEGTVMDKKLFLDDQIHLNRKGYEMLDSCIASAIAEDLRIK